MLKIKTPKQRPTAFFTIMNPVEANDYYLNTDDHKLLNYFSLARKNFSSWIGKVKHCHNRPV